MNLKNIYTKATFFLFLAAESINFVKASDTFNPESSKFSQIETIKTWVADKNQNNPAKIESLQQSIAKIVPENPYSRNFQKGIISNDGDNRDFGKSFPTITDIELPFLQYVKKAGIQKSLVTLELAAGPGFVSWKVPLCFGKKGGKHYANELSTNMISSINQHVSHWLVEFPHAQKQIDIIPGDCFSISESHAHLTGSVDVLYAQNLEHFFNPNQHQEFLNLIETLLAPGGRAFLCANTFTFKKEDDLYHLYLSQKKKNDPYPGFASYVVELNEVVAARGYFTKFVVSNAKRPSDDADVLMTRRTISGPTLLPDLVPLFQLRGQMEKVMELTQEVSVNAFSPGIYQRLLNERPSLTHIDSFWLDIKGKNIGTSWNKAKNSYAWAAVIFEKKIENNNNNNA